MTATTRGQDELADGRGPERPDGVDLLGDGHGPELGRDPGADRAATIRAVSVGPSSRQRERTTTRPTKSFPPNCDSE